MAPFEYVILFFSFIFTLGLTHLLFAATRMLRHRREIVFSWPHALWMLAALLNLPGLWLSMWDMRGLPSLSLAIVAILFLLVICIYFICALVSPDFEEGEGYDLVAFHQREGATYIGAFLLMLLVSIAANYATSNVPSINDWVALNGWPLSMAVLCCVALAVRRPWVQFAAPIGMVAVNLALVAIYYPRLTG